MQKLLTMTLASALLIPLAGCATTAGVGIEASCRHWKPITWSKKDTPPTVDGVKANNARRQAWCER